MSARRATLACGAALLAATLGGTRAEADLLAMTLPERVETAAAIVFGPMLEIRESAPDANGLTRREGRIRVERVLKGAPRPGETLTVALPPRGPGGRRTDADLAPPLDAPRLWLPTARAEALRLDRPDRILPLSALPAVARILAPAP